MTTVRAASSATLSVALEPRRAAVARRAVAQEAVLLAVVPREAVPQEVAAVILQESRTVVAVVPAAMTTTIMQRLAVVVEAVGDSFGHKTYKTHKTLFSSYWESNGSQPLAVAYPD